MALEPITVWMVHARTGPSGRRGRLSLTRDGVRFQPRAEGEPDTVIAFEDIRRVRRMWASPVLELALRTPNRVALEILGFYFTKPPPLQAPESIHIFRRRRMKTRAVNELRRANPVHKETVVAWAEAIKQAKAGEGGEPGAS